MFPESSKFFISCKGLVRKSRSEIKERLADHSHGFKRMWRTFKILFAVPCASLRYVQPYQTRLQAK